METHVRSILGKLGRPLDGDDVRRGRDTQPMLLQPAHVGGTRIVHLTHTTLVIEALCGENAESHGEPDLAVICDECFEIALLERADVSSWLTVIAHDVTLPLAA